MEIPLDYASASSLFNPEKEHTIVTHLWKEYDIGTLQHHNYRMNQNVADAFWSQNNHMRLFR